MPLINCKTNPTLTWPENCDISKVSRVASFAITDTKLYLRVVTLSTTNNAKSLQQLSSSFRRKINWNKYINQKNQLKDKTDT